MTKTRRFLYLFAAVLVTVGIYLNWRGTFPGTLIVLFGTISVSLTAPPPPPRPFLPRSTLGWVLAAGIVVVGTSGFLYLLLAEDPGFFRNGSRPHGSPWSGTESLVVWVFLIGVLAILFARESLAAKAAASRDRKSEAP